MMLGRTTGSSQRLGSFSNEQCIFGVRHPRCTRKPVSVAGASQQTRFATLPEEQKAERKAEKQFTDDHESHTAPAEQDVQSPAASTSSNPLANFWSGYQRRVETDPVSTKALTSFMGFVIGDILAQRIEGPAYNVLRTLRLGTYGLFLDGPIGHWWYTVLDKNVEPKNPTGTKAVLLKTAADQLVWAPVMTCVFFAVLKSLEGHPELIMPTIQDKLLKTVAANYVIWPAAHFINFRFVPTEHRILYNNIVSVAWTAYLSTLSHVPIVDVEDISSQLTEAQTQIFEALPPEFQSGASQAAKAARETLRNLPSLDSLLQPGQHFGLDLTIPKTIEIRSPRAMPGSVSFNNLASWIGKQ